MKTTLKNLLIVALMLPVLVLTSCRTEEMEIINPPQEEVVGVNSTIAQLMQQVALNDGSGDNILDGASCFEIQLPVTVIANGIEITVTDEDDFDIIEDIFDEFSDDTDTLEIIFPITIILEDFTLVVIEDQAQFDQQVALCGGPNADDDDIECIDFQYPITASVFNLNNELIETVVITSDEELFDFIDDIDSDTIVTFQFPITVILWDGTTQIVNNFTELQSVIQNAADQCDEDDDNDINDDDCNNCTTTQLEDLLTGCSDWMVDKLERNDDDLEDLYVGYLFNFNNDGTLTVDNGATTFNGTWASSGTANNITVSIDVAGLPDFNDDWILHEIDDFPGEKKVDLRLGDDRLRFESDCLGGGGGGGGGGLDDTALVNALTTGDWYVTFYFDDVDETANYQDYTFNFATDGTATATDSGGSTPGTWSTSAGDETDLELNLNFGTTIPLDELADDWDVLEATNDIIRLKDVSGGDGSEDFLTFERDPFGGGGGGGGSTLEAILEDGLWFVAMYDEDGDDQTAPYVGYEIDFMNGGTVTATNGSNNINGTWAVLSGGNQMLLDFGTQFPFDEFNDDDWEVLSSSDTEVVLQDVSGGGGGTDTLTLQKL